jgi:tRNA threonylcarbamoyladenosine biosynthesis protein TsaB
VIAEETLPERGASAEIIAAVRRLLKAVGWELSALDGVGVVSGPGSFTGVRTGVAAAKGLCEVTGIKLAAVSRLAILAEGMSDGFVALFAGRGELYVREVLTGHEWLTTADPLRARAMGQPVRIAEERVRELLQGLDIQWHALRVSSALPFVLQDLDHGGGDLATIDANYVRGESEIYRKPGEVKA